jgi:hypothetical protein
MSNATCADGFVLRYINDKYVCVDITPTFYTKITGRDCPAPFSPSTDGARCELPSTVIGGYKDDGTPEGTKVANCSKYARPGICTECDITNGYVLNDNECTYITCPSNQIFDIPQKKCVVYMDSFICPTMYIMNDIKTNYYTLCMKNFYMKQFGAGGYVVNNNNIPSVVKESSNPSITPATCGFIKIGVATISGVECAVGFIFVKASDGKEQTIDLTTTQPSSGTQVPTSITWLSKTSINQTNEGYYGVILLPLGNNKYMIFIAASPTAISNHYISTLGGGPTNDATDTVRPLLVYESTVSLTVNPTTKLFNKTHTDFEFIPIP